MPFPWAAATPFILKGLDFIGGMFGARQQRKTQEMLNERQYNHDLAMMKYQLDYNDPESQMQRFKDAGLNPHLIYGQGTPGNLDSPPRYPSQQAPSVEHFSNLGTSLAQIQLMQSQAKLTDTKVQESTVKQDLMRAQKNVADANPWLNKSYVNSMVLQLESTAKLKEQEMMFMTQGIVRDGKYQGEAGMVKMRYEIDNLAQRNGLNTQDQEVKAKIIESMQFKNSLLEIQEKWMKDAEITPQHIYLGIQMLLSKMF